MEEENYLLTLQDAARILGVRPITLRKWDREGKLKAVRVGPRADRKYDRREIEKFLEKSKRKGLEWREYIRSGTNYHHIIPAIEGFRVGVKEHFGEGLKFLTCYFENDTLFWYYEDNDLYENGKRIVKRLIEDEMKREEFFKEWDQKSNEIIDFCQSFQLEDMKIKKDAIEGYSKFIDLISEWYGFTMIIDATDDFLMKEVSQQIRGWLSKNLGREPSEKEFIETYNTLTAPKKLIYLNDERKMTLEISRDLRDSNLEEDSKEYFNRIEEILKMFWWTSLGWPRGNAKERKDIIYELAELRDSKTNIDNELNRIYHYEKNSINEKSKLFEKFDIQLSKDLSDLLNLLDRLFIYHDYRKEVQLKYNFFQYKLLDKIGDIAKVQTSLLEWSEPEEILSLLKEGKYDEKEINLRGGHFLYSNLDGEVRKFSGKKAQREHHEIVNSNSEETRDIQGSSACTGKVVGEALVGITLSTALTIKEGEILVTGMTTPDFLPAMRKASAFVTDEGGITCHAAIVAREMNKPCIIGTKNATKVIRTGDLIEVAANHGVVRILEKPK